MTFNYQEISKIIVSSFKEAFLWELWKWILGVGVSLLSAYVIPLGKEFFEWEDTQILKLSLLFILAIYVLRFILLLIAKSFKYIHELYKNSVYGDAIIKLTDSFAEAHLYRKTPGFQEEQFMRAMIVFCNNLKEIYDRTTMSECSVSIKVPILDTKVSEGTTLRNLTRNFQHKNRDTDEYRSINHSIIGNSAFNNSLNKVITGQEEKYYLNNDVNNTKNYLNTSKICYENGILPYNSELVYPITPIKNTDTTNFNCHGFICIDSTKKNAFDQKYSVAIMKGVADGIYDVISELNTNRNERGKQKA